MILLAALTYGLELQLLVGLAAPEAGSKPVREDASSGASAPLSSLEDHCALDRKGQVISGFDCQEFDTADHLHISTMAGMMFASSLEINHHLLSFINIKDEAVGFTPCSNLVQGANVHLKRPQLFHLLLLNEHIKD